MQSAILLPDEEYTLPVGQMLGESRATFFYTDPPTRNTAILWILPVSCISETELYSTVPFVISENSADSDDKIGAAIVPEIIGTIDPASRNKENHDESNDYSNNREMINKNSADSDDKTEITIVPKIIDPVDPASINSMNM